MSIPNPITFDAQRVTQLGAIGALTVEELAPLRLIGNGEER